MGVRRKSVVLPELLAPAGSIDKLKVAIHYGADAVYLGSGAYGLRAHAVLSRDDLATAVSYAHQHAVKAYVTVNIIAHNRDLKLLEDYFLFLADIEADGLIISDPGILRIASKVVPHIPIHLSTQANTTNTQSALFWHEQGVKRINLARELGLAEIVAIREQCGVELEVFVHGALCIAYSGRCSLSLYMTGRNANYGNCAHPCRYKYRLEEEKRPGQYFAVEEDNRGTYIFNSKDLCLLDNIGALIMAGADSLKIEGRMKSVYYVGAIVRLYRAALDYLQKQAATLQAGSLDAITLPPAFKDELMKIGSRGYTENFIKGIPTANDMLFDGIRIKQSHAPIGIVCQGGGKRPLIEMRNPLFQGEKVEYLDADLTNLCVSVTEMRTEAGERLEKANPGNRVWFSTEPELDCWRKNGLLRRTSGAE